MTKRLALISAIASGLIAATAGLGYTASDDFDLSPQQKDRVRAEKSEKAIEAVSRDFKFISDGKLTIGLNPGNPPLSTYATDATTVVGYDVDLAQLVADSLGRELVLVPVAWADWPLGLQSGKFDAVISNVTVTEQRKEKFDFSTYRKDELGFYVKADGPIKSIKEPKDIAGLKVITDPAISRFLGTDPSLGQAIGLDPKFAYNIIKTLGNYGEIFDRTIGKGSPVGFERGYNQPWTQGGLLYSPPFR